MGGRLFASLSEASPVLSYIVGGGIFWTLSTALDALTPDQSPTRSEAKNTSRRDSYSYEAFPLITRYYYCYYQRHTYLYFLEANLVCPMSNGS
jgi:hypothetical protein